jgi:predicted amidohydrolase YtcJ
MSSPSATVLIRNARVYTMNPQQPWAEALALAGNRIAWCGADADAAQWRGAGTREIDGGGGLLLPGLIDSHFHLLKGSLRLGNLWLSENEDLPTCLERLRAFAASRPNDPWLQLSGWNYTMFAGGTPIHRRLLDGVVPDRPVYAEAFDGHCGWANTVALERAGILQGADAGANSVVVVGDDGLATGELREFAAMDLVRALVPKPTRAEEDALLRQGLQLVASHGITAIHNMDGDPDQIARYAALADVGALSLRVYCPMLLSPEMSVADVDELVAAARPYQGPLVRGGCIKMFLDGVVEAKTALMLAPYAGVVGDERGEANYEQAHFDHLIERADALQQQIFVHAIGDAAVRQTLDAYQRARAANGPRDARHRVEHIEVIDAADVGRLRELSVIASLQPLHAEFGYDDDNPWRALVGPERWPLGFAWRTLLDAGAQLALGSDWPVVSMDPLRGFRAALRRRKLDGSDASSAFPDHRLTLHETVAGYTTGAAYAEFAENERGMLRPGMQADLVLLSHDLFAKPAALDDVRVALTISDGRVVYEG